MTSDAPTPDPLAPDLLAPDLLAPDADIDAATLARYVSAESGPADVAVVERWAAADPARARRLAALQRIWAAAAEPRSEWNVDDLWRGLTVHLSPAAPPPASQPDTTSPSTTVPSALSRLRQRVGPTPHQRPQGVGGGAWSAWHVRVAIAGGLFVAAGGLVFGGRMRGRTPQAVRELATPAGGRATVTLCDGTRLTLGPATRLHVPSDFGSSTRTVELDGEAYFAVTHDAKRPFAVRTRATTVRDVGTVFTVRAYATDPREQVAVLEGAVSLGPAILRAREVATVSRSGDVVVHGVPDIAPYFAWLQGRLTFTDTPLRDVARELGRAFDLDIGVVDSVLASKPVTGSFTDQPVDGILDDITSVIGADFQRTGRVVTIRRKARGTGRPGSKARESVRTVVTTDPHE